MTAEMVHTVKMTRSLRVLVGTVAVIGLREELSAAHVPNELAADADAIEFPASSGETRTRASASFVAGDPLNFLAPLASNSTFGALPTLPRKYFSPITGAGISFAGPRPR